jgi:hypothetical protein
MCFIGVVMANNPNNNEEDYSSYFAMLAAKVCLGTE